MDEVSHPPEIVLTNLDELATITANMIHSFLKQEKIMKLKKQKTCNTKFNHTTKKN